MSDPRRKGELLEAFVDWLPVILVVLVLLLILSGLEVKVHWESKP